MATYLTIRVDFRLSVSEMCHILSRWIEDYGGPELPKTRAGILALVRSNLTAGHHGTEDPASDAVVRYVGIRLNALFPELEPATVPQACACGHFDDQHFTSSRECMLDDCDCTEWRPGNV